MRPAQTDDGSTYYEYVLLYVDDILCISLRPEDIIRNEIGKYFHMKEESIGKPNIYLGNKVSKVTLENDVHAWAYSSARYIKSAVQNVKDYLKLKKLSLPTKANSPMTSGYRPELDTSNELNPSEAAYYQSLIGILRWIVELGRPDICVKVSMLTSHMAFPRRGHLDQLYRIFAYLDKHHNSEIVFDPTPPEIPDNLFEKHDWLHTVHGNCHEEIPYDAPTRK